MDTILQYIELSRDYSMMTYCLTMIWVCGGVGYT